MKTIVKTKAVAYCRVSTASSDQENSFENQKSYFQREISKNESYLLYRIYADRGISGTSLNRREEFSAMLYDAGLDETKINSKKTVFTASRREPLFHKIYVKNTSRFARNVLVIDVLRELLKKGVFVYFLDINLLFDSIEKEFMLNLFLNFSQQESIDKSTKVRFGAMESARKGNLYFGGRIYGYTYNRERRELVINEEEAEVIKTIFNMYVNGYGVRRILNHLEASEIKTREGKSFVPSAIKRMLANEKYCGILVRNKYDSGIVFNKKTPTIRPQDEWKVFEDRVPAIITKELFEAANRERKSKVNHVNQKGIYKGTSEYAGKIYCGKCNHTYTRNTDDGRVFFNCSLKKTKGKMACDNVNVKETLIESHITDLMSNGIIATFALQKDKQVKLLHANIEALDKRIDTPSIDTLKIKQRELSEVEEEETTLVRMVVKGQVKEALFDELKSDIDKRKEQLLLEINELDKTNAELLYQIEEVERKIVKLEALTIKPEYSRKEILDLINKFIVTKNEDGTPHLTYELSVFDSLAQA